MATSTLKKTFATLENFRKLEELEKKVNQLKEEADAVEECGIDCQVFRMLADQWTHNLENYRKQFFTPPPEI